ncbi:MAG: flagellar FliJ family protein [Planctomycetota bacterium]
MKRFHFQLEGLLRMRTVEADRQRGQLQKCMAAIVAVHDEIAAIEQKRAEQFEMRSQGGTGPLSMEDVKNQQRYLNVLHREEATLSAKLPQLQQELALAQQRHGHALKEQRAVERLREQRYEEYVIEAQRHDMGQLDETSQQLRQLRSEEVTS